MVDLKAENYRNNAELLLEGIWYGSTLVAKKQLKVYSFC